jgi:hypothetical protein
MNLRKKNRFYHYEFDKFFNFLLSTYIIIINSKSTLC